MTGPSLVAEGVLAIHPGTDEREMPDLEAVLDPAAVDGKAVSEDVAVDRDDVGAKEVGGLGSLVDGREDREDDEGMTLVRVDDEGGSEVRMDEGAVKVAVGIVVERS